MQPLSRSLTLLTSVMLLALSGCDQGPGEGRTAVITSITSPQLMTKCPDGQCIQYTVQNLRCGRSMRASTVIVAGPALPPGLLDTTPDAVARAVACFHPELVVLDTCYGTSTDYLKAFVKAGITATVVGSPRKVPAEGYVYGPAFWTRAPVAERAAAVQSLNPAQTMLRWSLNGAMVEKAEQLVAGMSKEEMAPRLHHAVPNLVKVEPEPGVELLVPVPSERLR